MSGIRPTGKAGLLVNSSEIELGFQEISNWSPSPSCDLSIGSPVDPAIDLPAQIDPPFAPAASGGEGVMIVERDPLGAAVRSGRHSIRTALDPSHLLLESLRT
ncbi:hypothetical protein QCM80_29905 [Bradyrhizobium sp. SSUT112]|uniref:hypothetical protein n=1 Tax=Bradyrhizobium sp. SSUT112 TaxID=3040604 RepID=UPI00244A16C9|nr:hypothetical protein [Bradyrhizobium sp. SSUT112]MDH2354850.1 hypothetical protein [Bradyrhizobium sp. SSUT112]